MDKREGQLSLYHLNLIVQEIADIIDTLGNIQPLPKSLFVPIHKHIIIRTCAFYDEIKYQTLKVLKTDEQRYKALVKVEHYIVTKREDYFSDLHKIRNNILAHNYRVKSESCRSVFEKETFYIFPNSIPELIVNTNLMDTMLSSIKYLYPEIHEMMNNEIHELKAMETSINGTNYESFNTEIQQDVQKIVDEELKKTIE